MSLRIRRGTDAQRQTLTFDQGEVVYTTDTKKVYIGDGITAGGVNILANSAGSGVTFNPTTQTFDFSTNNLNLTTSAVSEGANKYFTTQRAQDAAAALFTNVGSPATTGTVTGTVATGTVTLLATPSPLLEQGEKFTVIGTGGGGLTASGTYFVVSNLGTSVVLASSLANAMSSTAITTLSTASLTGTTFSSGGTDTGITFVYDSVTHTMSVASTGVTTVSSDTNPSLGGNLTLNSRNITGTGNIDIVGTVKATTGLGGNLPLNSYNINGTGNIDIVGTVKATTGLGGNLPLNSYNINGTGGINITGTITATALSTSTLTLGSNSTVNGGPVNFNIGNSIFFNSSPAAGTPFLTYFTASANTLSSIVSLAKSRGTVFSPASVISGDSLGSASYAGFTGSAFTAGGSIDVVVNGSVSTGVLPTQMKFNVNNTAGTSVNPVTVNASNITFTKPPIVPIFADASARDAAISPATAGMIVFLTSTTKFQGYTGSAWADLN
jgi:hypothetical protein